MTSSYPANASARASPNLYLPSRWLAGPGGICIQGGALRATEPLSMSASVRISTTPGIPDPFRNFGSTQNEVLGDRDFHLLLGQIAGYNVAFVLGGCSYGSTASTTSGRPGSGPRGRRRSGTTACCWTSTTIPTCCRGSTTTPAYPARPICPSSCGTSVRGCSRRHSSHQRLVALEGKIAWLYRRRGGSYRGHSACTSSDPEDVVADYGRRTSIRR